MKRLLAAAGLLATAMVCAPNPARAQDTTMVFVGPDSATRTDSAEVMMGMMDSYMGPMMGRMMERMLEGLLNVLSRPESAERLATFTRNYYEALVKRGFTADQALRLTAAVGFPSIAGGGGG